MAEISREDAIKFLKAHSECEKKKVKGICEECNEELCDNCDLCYAQGNCGEHIKATDKAISDMEKLEKIEQIIKKYDLQDITRDDVDDIVSGFEYEIIMAVLGKDIEV